MTPRWLVASMLAASCSSGPSTPAAAASASQLEAAGSIEIDLATLEDEQAGATLPLQLDAEHHVTVMRSRIDRRAAGDFSWFGTIDGDGRVVIAVKARRLWGSIVYAGRMYPLGPDPRDALRLASLRWTAARPPHPRAEVTPARHPPPLVLAQDGPIEVLVAYTREAKEACPDVELVGQNAFDWLTTIVADSKIPVSFHLAGIVPMDSSERQSGSIAETLAWFAGRGDSHYESIHTRRCERKADLNVLVVDQPWAQGMTVAAMANAEEAFSVVDWESATSTFAFAHEIGHQMGLNDDGDNLDEVTFKYGFGYSHESSTPGQSWRTVMAKAATCKVYSCPRAPRFSTADATVTYRGAATGDADHDSGRVLAATAGYVSRFASSVCPPAARAPTRRETRP